VARTASLTLTRSRFAFFAVALLTVKRKDRPMTIRAKVEDIGHELRSRSKVRLAHQNTAKVGTTEGQHGLLGI
jgi:hypothetical protein